MKMPRGRGWLQLRRIALGTALVLVVSSAVRADERWLTSYDEALQAAERTGRPVLTIFTGSDWCPHCVTLEKKVLETSTFLEWAENRVILLMIDLPQQGISHEQRVARSKVCIKYAVRSFPSMVLIAPDGGKITCQAGYQGQSPETWLAALDKHVPAPAAAVAVDPGPQGAPVLSSVDEAVETARDRHRPVLLLVSRPDDYAAKTRVTSLINDPEFESVAREHFVVAQVPPQEGSQEPAAGAPETLLGGVPLPPEAVELVVTEDGETPVLRQSGSQPATRIVSGLRRFLAARQASRLAEPVR